MAVDRNGRRWTIALLTLSVCVPLIAGMVQIGKKVVQTTYQATKLKVRGGSHDVPIERYASSEAILSPLGTSVAEIEKIRPRLDPHGDAVLLASRASPVDHGSFYLQLLYFLPPRTVALLECREPAGLVMPRGDERRIAGVIYQSMSPPKWIVAGRQSLSMSRPRSEAAATPNAEGDGIYFVPFTQPVKEILDWTRFCR